MKQYSSLSQVWALLAEGIVKEADKLACLVLTVPVSQYCKGTFWAVQMGNTPRKSQQSETCSVMEASVL